MEVNFDDLTVNDFSTVPAGSYLCRVSEVRLGTTRGGDERWSLRLTVAAGELMGRMAAWDSIVFSSRGLARVRLVFKALGLPHKGVVNIEPRDLEGRHVCVTVQQAEYLSASGDTTVIRNEVPYDGYRPPVDWAGGGS